MEDERGFVGLKRLPGGETVTIRNKVYDTRHVVSYNRYLLIRFNAHINVLPFVNMRMVFYITKYICKGYDQARVDVTTRLLGVDIDVSL